MKKLLTVLICVLAAALVVSCGKKEQDEGLFITVSFLNEVEEADIWILPQTPEILKTTLWGTATSADLGTGSKIELSLKEPEEAGTYIFRAIGSKGMYYEANDILIEEGSFILFRRDGEFTQVLEVTGPGGGDPVSYELFSARL